MTEKISYDIGIEKLRIAPIVRNKCGHNVNWIVTFTEGNDIKFTYCLKCLFDKVGLKPL